MQVSGTVVVFVGSVALLLVAFAAGAAVVTTDLFTVNLLDAYAAPVQSWATQPVRCPRFLRLH